jgi:hypothetical protein
MHSGLALWQKITGASLSLNGRIPKHRQNNIDGWFSHKVSLIPPILFGQVLEQVSEGFGLPPQMSLLQYVDTFYYLDLLKGR